MLGAVATRVSRFLLAVVVAQGCAVPEGPVCPPQSGDAAMSSDAPSSVMRTDGTAELEIVATSSDGKPVAGLPLKIACPGVEPPLAVQTDAEGKVVAVGLPAVACEIHTAHNETAYVTLTADVRTDAALEDQPVPLSVGAREAVDALPADVVLELSGTGYTAQLHDDNEVSIDRGGEQRAWIVTSEAATFSLARARCLANGPSYPQAMAEGGETFRLRVRDGDGIATYVEVSTDARAPQGQYEQTRDLEEALKIERLLD